MKTPAALVHVWILTACLASCAMGPNTDGTGDKPNAADQATPAEQLASMTWLEGNWAGPTPKGVWEAHYTSPGGGTILGMSKEQKKDGSAFSEFEWFGVRDGKLAVIPYPKGARSMPFFLVELDREKQLAAFENPRNSFPQRFEYWRVDEDTLVIKLRNLEKRNDKYQGFVLTLKRR